MKEENINYNETKENNTKSDDIVKINEKMEKKLILKNLQNKRIV